MNYNDKIEPFGLCLPIDKNIILGISEYTYFPFFCTYKSWEKDLRHKFKDLISKDLFAYIERNIKETLRIRSIIEKKRYRIESIIGSNNFNTLWGAREAYSTDSTEFRTIPTEAIASIYSKKHLLKFIKFCFKENIPIIPFGGGGGYNMGIIPYTPSITIAIPGLGEIQKVDYHITSKEGQIFSVKAGAGASYKDIIKSVEDEGFVLRCQPNTPRASLGGIIASGSNGGKRIHEVLLSGSAIVSPGKEIYFAQTGYEKKYVKENGFLVFNKFYGIKSGEVNLNLCSQAFYPSSLFVSAEGTTGIISEASLQVEKKLDYAFTSSILFEKLSEAITFIQSIKSQNLNPHYFEMITEPAISMHLKNDFPNIFNKDCEAYLMLSCEADKKDELKKNLGLIIASLPSAKIDFRISDIYSLENVPSEATAMIEPRELLPKKMKSKCKTDSEISFSYLNEAVNIIKNETKHCQANEKEINDLFFGHLSLPNTAIMHWNVAGFDIYNEDDSKKAWSFLNESIAKLAAANSKDNMKYAFSGEHGISGKANKHFYAYLAKDEFQRISCIKKFLDPKDIFNRGKLFAENEISQKISARALNFSSEEIEKLRNENHDINEILSLASKCTRCTSCNICPVTDSQSRLNYEFRGISSWQTMFSKKDILYLLEKLVFMIHSKMFSAKEIKKILKEFEPSLQKCFYCKRCDINCPSDINIEVLKSHYYKLIDQGEWGNKKLKIILNSLLGDWSFKKLFHSLVSVSQKIMLPFMKLACILSFKQAAIRTYLNAPKIPAQSYDPLLKGKLIHENDNIVLQGHEIENSHESTLIRFRGCAESYFQPKASESFEKYYTELEKIPFWDFKNTICCGFPYKAEGFLSKAEKLKEQLEKEIKKAIKIIKERNGSEDLTIVTSCPTCLEMLKDIGEKNLKIEDSIDHLYKRTGEQGDRGEKFIQNSKLKIQNLGIKIPCHNKDEVTTNQIKFLESFFGKIKTLDKCCGLAGISRYKHPLIGGKIAQELFKDIKQINPENIVSSCPSCRDGLCIQGKIEGSSVQINDIYSVLLEHRNSEKDA
ncbi:MAG: FAD-binding and (Fe-S)-binding domain-containing protein [Pseudomonadota bacterium]